MGRLEQLSIPFPEKNIRIRRKAAFTRRFRCLYNIKEKPVTIQIVYNYKKLKIFLNRQQKEESNHARTARWD